MKKLVAQYQDTLLSFFNKRSQNAWDAEELTQEVFYKLLKCKDMGENQYPESYLYSVAWSVLRDKSRRDKVRQKDNHIEFNETYAREDLASPEQVINSEQLYQQYVAALGELSPKVRAVFLLHRYEGLTYAEIAAHCDITVSAVEKHMMKALTRMKKFLKEQI